MCLDEGILVLQLLPHASDQFQPLDIGIFHVQKTKMQRMTVDRRLSAQMLDAFTYAATVSNVVSAFHGAGIISNYDKEDDCLYPYVDRSAAKKVGHWKHEEEI